MFWIGLTWNFDNDPPFASLLYNCFSYSQPVNPVFNNLYGCIHGLRINILFSRKIRFQHGLDAAHEIQSQTCLKSAV